MTSRSDGTLVPDVKVGAWEMPWNAKPDAGRLAKGIPPSNFWASDPNASIRLAASTPPRASGSTTSVSSGALTYAGTPPRTTGSVTRATPTTPSSSAPATASPTSSSAPTVSSSPAASRAATCTSKTPG